MIGRRRVLRSFALLPFAGVAGCSQYPRTRVSHTTVWFANETDREIRLSCTIERRDAIPLVRSETAYADRLSVGTDGPTRIDDVVRPSRDYTIHLAFDDGTWEDVNHEFTGHHGVLYAILGVDGVEFDAAPAEG